MNRPWVTSKDVKDYSDSEKVKARADNKLAVDISRAEAYVISNTHNKFDTGYVSVPADIKTAVILLSEAYAKQAILQKEGRMESETFDDYSYTVASDTELASSLGLGPLLEAYILEADNGKVTMKLRKL